MLDVRRQALGLLEAGHSCRHVSRVLGVGVNPVRRWAMLAGMELMRGRHGRARAVPHAEPVDPAGPLTGQDRSSAVCTVHVPVPFMRARSAMTSTRSAPVRGSA